MNFNTVFTNAYKVSRVIPNCHYIPGIINTEFYLKKEKLETETLHIVFCAGRVARKNFYMMIQAFNMLNSDFHLHIVGNWQEDLGRLTNSSYTYYGNMNPLQLRAIYEKCHVFVSCSTEDQFALDGFPTTAAAEAMSTGCVLISTNSRGDDRVFQAGEDYFKIDENNAIMLTNTLKYVKEHLELSLRRGPKAADKIILLIDARTNVDRKLKIIFSHE